MRVLCRIKKIFSSLCCTFFSFVHTKCSTAHNDIPDGNDHEILNAHKYENIKKFGLFEAPLSLECNFSRSYMLKCQQLLAF